MSDPGKPEGQPADPDATQPYPSSGYPSGGYPPSGYGPPSGYPPPGYGPPPGFPTVTGPPQEPGRSVLPFVAGILVGGGLLGAGLWFFLAGPGAPAAPTTSAPPIAVVTPPASAATFAPPTPAPSAAGATPTAGGSTGPPSTAGPGTGGPPPSIDPAVEAQIREVTAQVPPIRGLEPLAMVPFRFLTAPEAAIEFEASFREANPPERIAAEDALLERLGLLGRDDDLEDLVLALYQSQVAAFYDPRGGQFTIITRDGFEFGPAERLFTAHEYDHALQDQHFDLEGTRVTDPSEGDRALAELALTEGDATALMNEWALQHLTLEEILGIVDAVSPTDQALLESMPLVLRRQLLFPYLDGLAFVNHLQAQDSWAAVDAAWEARPISTEQILHPEKYVAGEQPFPIELADLAATLGEGWTTGSTQTMGEMLIGVLVADGVEGPSLLPGIPGPLANAEAAAGWGADRLVSLEGPEGAWAVTWQTDWDSPTDAAEFQTAAEAAMSDLPFPHELTVATIAGELGSPVLVLIASDVATLDVLKLVVALES